MIAKILVYSLFYASVLKILKTTQVQAIECREDGDKCIFSESTTINRNDLRITQSDDEKIKALSFSSNNKKVEFMPIFINDTFPRLDQIKAENLAIKKICRENFVNLHYLKRISLEENQIEKISSDTFAGLWRLQLIDLRE